jgi:hypothetical protein
MVIDMNEQNANTVAQLRAFLEGTDEVRFEPFWEDDKRYAFVTEVVTRLLYRQLQRADKTVVMQYLERTTGYATLSLGIHSCTSMAI